MTIESVDSRVIQIVHPLCLTATTITSIALGPFGEFLIEAICPTCDRYIYLTIKDARAEHRDVVPTVEARSLREQLDQLERTLLATALREADYNIAAAARSLATSRTTFYRRCLDYDLPVDRKPRS